MHRRHNFVWTGSQYESYRHKLKPIPKPSSLVSWSQICLLNSIAVFETVRSYQLKKYIFVGTQIWMQGKSSFRMNFKVIMCVCQQDTWFMYLQCTHLLSIAPDDDVSELKRNPPPLNGIFLESCSILFELRHAAHLLPFTEEKPSCKPTFYRMRDRGMGDQQNAKKQTRKLTWCEFGHL